LKFNIKPNQKGDDMLIKRDFYPADEPWLSLDSPFLLLPSNGSHVAPQAAGSEEKEIPCKL
jgi:hypothetical protein